jgi:hypothetical protein
MTTTTDTISKANARRNFIKKASPQKFLYQRTLHTFAFDPNTQAQGKDKDKRVQSPMLYVTMKVQFFFVTLQNNLLANSK